MKYDLPFPIWENEELKYKINQYYFDGTKTVQEYNNLIAAFEELTGLSFYYSYNIDIDNNKDYHMHAHTFEEVIRDLYRYPKSFYLKDEDKKWYSEQEIKYLNALQKFLIGVGREDTKKVTKGLCKNKYANDFAKYFYAQYTKDECEKIINSKEYIKKVPLPFKPLELYTRKKVLVDRDFNFYGIINIEETNMEENLIESVKYEELGLTIEDIKERYNDKIYIITEKITVDSLYNKE